MEGVTPSPRCARRTEEVKAFDVSATFCWLREPLSYCFGWGTTGVGNRLLGGFFGGHHRTEGVAGFTAQALAPTGTVE